MYIYIYIINLYYMMYYIYMIIQIKYVFMHILHYTRCMCVLSCMAEASVGLGETEYLQEVKRLVLNMAKKNVSISFGWICVCDLFVMSTRMNVHRYAIALRMNNFCGISIYF